MATDAGSIVDRFKEVPGHTLQPTALVHEAFIRLVGGDRQSNWEHRGHFSAAAALAMRRILVEQARQRATLKRGGDRRRVDVDVVEIAATSPSADVIVLEEAVRRLEAQDSRKGKIVNLRYYAGLTVEETAELLDVSVGTIERDWRYIKSWIFAELSEERSRDDPSA